MKEEVEGRLLVTGAAGLIGTEVSHQLRLRGYDVVTLDLRKRDQRGNPIDHIGDICDAKLRKEALFGVDGVVHLAAVSRVKEAEQDPFECTRVNLDGTRALLTDMVAMRRQPWVLFASSREVYGEPRWLPVGEDHILSPVNYYGRTKVECEALVSAYSETTSCQASILRYSNVYGNPLDHQDRLVPSFIEKALLEDELEVHGGGQTIDLMHVKDAAAITEKIATLMQYNGRWAVTINVGSGVGTTMDELIALIGDAADSDISIRYEAPQPGCVESYITDTRLMSDKLEFDCSIPLDEGIQDLVERYRKRLAPLQMVIA